MENLKIRPSTEQDLEAVLSVEREAFGSNDEAELVDNLLRDPTAQPLISLLAFVDDRPAGHILFTKIGLAGPDVAPQAMLLAPLAVIPEFQKMGIGGALIKEALRIATEQGAELVFVLGHPDYYPRSGFRPAGQFGLEAPYPIPAKNAGAWMVIETKPDLIGRIKGKVTIADALDRPEMWRE